MSPEADQFYAALQSRDARFDGRFFTGVLTTGVYCRPICPARTPKRANVRFFDCAAAAEAAGFRPCLRCRPETSPGTPAWMGTCATVARAMRWIADGTVNGRGVEELARRSGVGARQLRRLFIEHLGATPGAILRNHRVGFARRLIDETTLPMTEIALASGFRSVRQFNDAIRAGFGCAPTQLRRAAGSNGPSSDGRCLSLKLAYRPPLKWTSLLGFLSARAIPGVEVVDRTGYRRTIGGAGSNGTLRIEHVVGENHLLLHVDPPPSGSLLDVAARARRIFDLDADPLRIASHLRRDARLRRVAPFRPGLRVPGAWDGFELAVRAILGQQITVRGATALSGRLVDAFGRPLHERRTDGLTHTFPAPADLVDADLARLGLPGARAEAIRQLARAVCENTLSLDASPGLEPTVARLAALPGIGPWTAQYIAMRALREPDAFPASDLGLRKAVSTGDKPVSAREATRIAEAWRPWRAYAALFLWDTISPPNRRPSKMNARD